MSNKTHEERIAELEKKVERLSSTARARDVFRDAEAHPSDVLQPPARPAAAARRETYTKVTQREVFEVAADHGWWEDCQLGADKYKLDQAGVVQLIPEKLALIHSEITEAFEDLLEDKMTTFVDSRGKPCGWPSEISDVAIRVMVLAGALEDCDLDLECRRAGSTYTPLDLGMFVYGDTLDRCVNRLHRLTSHALEDYRKGYITTTTIREERALARPSGVYVRLALIVMACRALAERCGFDLDYEISIKHAYNKTRAYRHGNKKV